jgi:transcriptional regulator with XRE-family HTH domain
VFDPQDLATYIKECRKSHGLSQALLASHAHVRPNQVKRIEQGQELPMDARIRILRALESLA